MNNSNNNTKNTKLYYTNKTAETLNNPKTDWLWVFYHFQGEIGEDRLHPNAFKLSILTKEYITLSYLYNNFPIKKVDKKYHFRFRIDNHSNYKSTKESQNDIFYWLDIVNPQDKLPILNNKEIICKLLSYQKNKQLLQNPATDTVYLKLKKYNEPNNININQQIHIKDDTNNKDKIIHSATSNESLEDFLSGSSPISSNSNSNQSNLKQNSISPTNTNNTSTIIHNNNISNVSSTNNNDINKNKNINLNSNNNKMNDIYKSLNATLPSKKPLSFEDDGGQTVGPVTLAEIKSHLSSTCDGSNIYNPNLIDKNTKSMDIRLAMEERESKKNEDIKKARDEYVEREKNLKILENEKSNVILYLEPKLKKWAEENGKKKNIRTLLSTMHLVMWENSKWKECSIAKLIHVNEVKKQYRLAMLVTHPDKNSNRNIEQIIVAERVFDAINTAYEEFSAKELNV